MKLTRKPNIFTNSVRNCGMVVEECPYNRNLSCHQPGLDEKPTIFVAVECSSIQTIRRSVHTNEIASKIKVLLKGCYA